MIWHFAQGMITAIQEFFVPQIVVAIMNILTEIDRNNSQFYLEESHQEFQASLEGVRQKFNRELEDYRQFCENTRLQKRQDFEAEQLARRLQHEQRLEEYRRESQLILSRVQLLNAIELADDKEIRDTFPLKTPASVILKAYKSYQDNYRNIPVLVIISPPALEFEKFPNAAQGFSRIESHLTDEVQEFCKHYPLTSQDRPIRYQGADWESKSSHGKSAVDVLHHVLKSIPTLVLESKIDGDLLRIYLAGWDMLYEILKCEKVLTIPWKEVLYPIARQYAEKWREYRMILLDKGRSLEEIQRRGGDDELNLLILEEEEEDWEFGFTGDRDYKYNVKEEKYIQELAQFLGICHCILVGLLADRYHFFHADVRPKLPELLPRLLEKVPSENLKQMLVGEIVSSYQSLYQLAVGDRLHLIPDLYLDLALSLSHLPDLSWARKQIEYSIKVWLMLRNRVSAIEEQKPSLLELLETTTSALTVWDKKYVEKLNGCLAAIGENQHQKMIWEEVQRKEAEYKRQREAERQRQLEAEGQQQLKIERKRQQEAEHQRQLQAERQRQREIERKRKLENASVVCTLTGHSNSVNSVAISPDGQTFVSCSDDNTIKIWQLSTGKEIRTLKGHSDSVNSVAISPDGQTVVSGSDDKTIKIWQLSTGQELRTLQGDGFINSLAISPDGQILVSSSHTVVRSGYFNWESYTVVMGNDYNTINEIKIWQLSTGQELRTLQGDGSITSLAISPDGQILASSGTVVHFMGGGNDNTITIWDLSTGEELRTLTVDLNWSVNSVAISPDGQTLVSGGDDTITIWDLSTGQELGTLTGHSYEVQSLAISPDGQTLVSGSGDGTINIWRVA